MPSSEALIQRAVSTIRLANRMLNQNLAEAGEAGGRLATVKHTLVFQPVEVRGASGRAAGAGWEAAGACCRMGSSQQLALLQCLAMALCNV